MLKGRFMRYLFLLLPLHLVAQNSFITPMEYAASLYENPRAIGCQKCHGIKGEGKVVAKYIDKKENMSFSGPQINEMDFTRFYYALNKRIKGMPRYFLTQKEIESLYFYLEEKKKEAKK